MASFPEYIPPDPPLLVKPPPPSFQDPASHSSPGHYFTDHIHLDFTIDFTKKILTATATYRIRRLRSQSNSLILDIRGINIQSVTSGKTALHYTIDNQDSPIGSAVNIRIPPGLLVVDTEFFFVQIAYTTPGNGDGHQAGGALDWLSPEQTASKEVFAFTQCQSIHARSIVPCQDTPAVKSTYSAVARIAAPYQHLTVVMSAQRVPLQEGDDGTRFECGVPVPSYLIAFACGDIQFRELSNRSVVWAEPSVIESAAYEFAEVETMLKTAEEVAGRYVWGRYDMVVLPGSFPYGGMENPFLTFVTPTLLAGDRSLSNVIVHEIAHGWSGNLVSCQDPRHFWLNEGFTVKLERHILREMYGTGREGLDGTAGRRDLEDFIVSVGEDHKYTTLVSQIQKDEDPDDYFSIVCYEKGYNFLLYLEQTVEQEGGNFHEWLRMYFQVHQYQSINTTDFLNTFKEAFPKVFEMVDWETWLHGKGYCPILAPLDMNLVDQAVALADQWLDLFKEVDQLDYEEAVRVCRETLGSQVEEFKSWDAKQKHGFLTDLRARVVASQTSGEEGIVWNEKCPGYLEDIHEFNKEKNAEIRFMWCRLALFGWFERVLENVNDFVSIQGRMKFVRPLYTDLDQTYPKGSYAKDLFAINKSSYHSITVKMIEQDLGLAENYRK